MAFVWLIVFLILLAFKVGFIDHNWDYLLGIIVLGIIFFVVSKFGMIGFIIFTAIIVVIAIILNGWN